MSDEKLRRLERAAQADPTAMRQLAQKLSSGQEYSGLVLRGLATGDVYWPARLVAARVRLGKLNPRCVMAAETMGRPLSEDTRHGESQPWATYAQEFRDALGTTTLSRVALEAMNMMPEVFQATNGRPGHTLDTARFIMTSLNTARRDMAWHIEDEDTLVAGALPNKQFDAVVRDYAKACSKGGEDWFGVPIGVMGNDLEDEDMVTEMLHWGVRDSARTCQDQAVKVLVATRWFAWPLYTQILNGSWAAVEDAFPGTEQMLADASEPTPDGEALAEGIEPLAYWPYTERDITALLLGGDQNFREFRPTLSQEQIDELLVSLGEATKREYELSREYDSDAKLDTLRWQIGSMVRALRRAGVEAHKSAARSIRIEIQRGERQQGAELTEDDIGREIDSGFGVVLENDVGKRVWLRDYGISMDNDEQRDNRMRPRSCSVSACELEGAETIDGRRYCLRHLRSIGRHLREKQ
jgi:hypothetical protein